MFDSWSKDYIYYLETDSAEQGLTLCFETFNLRKISAEKKIYMQMKQVRFTKVMAAQLIEWHYYTSQASTTTTTSTTKFISRNQTLKQHSLNYNHSLGETYCRCSDIPPWTIKHKHTLRTIFRVTNRVIQGHPLHTFFFFELHNTVWVHA